MSDHNLLHSEIESYAEQHSKQPSKGLNSIQNKTYASLELPHMISGGYQVSLLQMLIQLHQPKQLLEIGMFSAYAASSFLEVMDSNAQLTTIEHSQEIIDFASPFVQDYLNSGMLKILHSDGQIACEEILNEHEFDFVFIDANKGTYPFYYEWAVNHVPSGGLIILDNMLWKGEVLDPKSSRSKKLNSLNKTVASDHRVDCTFLGIRDGLMLARKK